MKIVCMLAVAALVGCAEHGLTPIEELRAGIDAYSRGEPEPTEQQIDAWFARVDADVAALRAEAADEEGEKRDELQERARALQQERVALWQSYVKAKVARLRGLADDTVRDLGRQIGQGLEEAGRTIREAMEKPPPDEAAP